MVHGFKGKNVIKLVSYKVNMVQYIRLFISMLPYKYIK